MQIHTIPLARHWQQIEQQINFERKTQKKKSETVHVRCTNCNTPQSYLTRRRTKRNLVGNILDSYSGIDPSSAATHRSHQALSAHLGSVDHRLGVDAPEPARAPPEQTQSAGF